MTAPSNDVPLPPGTKEEDLRKDSAVCRHDGCSGSTCRYDAIQDAVTKIGARLDSLEKDCRADGPMTPGQRAKWLKEREAESRRNANREYKEKVAAGIIPEGYSYGKSKSAELERQNKTAEGARSFVVKGLRGH